MTKTARRPAARRSAARSASRPPLTPDQQALVADWYGRWTAIGLLARRFPGVLNAARINGLTDEDTRQAALLGVCEAARRFDPSRGVRFNTLATWYVRSGVQAAIDRQVGYCVRHLERKGRARPEVESGDADRADGSTWDTLAVWDECPVEGASAAEARDRIESLLGGLDARLRALIRLRYGLDGKTYTLDELGRAFGVTKERARQLTKKGLADLRACAGVQS